MSVALLKWHDGKFFWMATLWHNCLRSSNYWIWYIHNLQLVLAYPLDNIHLDSELWIRTGSTWAPDLVHINRNENQWQLNLQFWKEFKFICRFSLGPLRCLAKNPLPSWPAPVVKSWSWRYCASLEFYIYISNMEKIVDVKSYKKRIKRFSIIFQLSGGK